MKTTEKKVARLTEAQLLSSLNGILSDCGYTLPQMGRALQFGRAQTLALGKVLATYNGKRIDERGRTLEIVKRRGRTLYCLRTVQPNGSAAETKPKASALIFHGDPWGVEVRPMPCFEKAFDPLAGFVFADEQSYRNALWALYWGALKNSGVLLKVPLIVITGVTGAGKSRLASKLSLGTSASVAKSQTQMESLLTAASEDGEGFIVFEDAGSEVLESLVLKTFLTATSWSFKRRHGEGVAARSAMSMVIVTGTDIVLNEAMARRALVINLLPRR